MTPYRIELRPSAVQVLRKMDPPAAQRIRGAIALLAIDPRPPNSKKLTGRPGLRVRVGDYRVIYTVEDDVLVIIEITIVHRSEVYR